MRTKFFLNRRDFLRRGTVGLGGAAFLGIKSVSTARDMNHERRAGTGDFVDAHVHVWTSDFGKYPLAPAYTPQETKPTAFLPQDIVRQAEPSGVKRIVLVQMSYYGFDNSYMLDIVHSSPQMFRGIAVVNWESSEPDVTMRRLAKEGVRGFRIHPDRSPSATWLDGKGFDKMFRCGAKEGLALCPLIDPDALPAVALQCERFPDTPVVIDHIARVGADGIIRDSDIRALCALTRYPHVKLKVSAFYALGDKKPPHLDLIPLIKRIYEAYGPKRLMWGSDCPFRLMNETYEDSISLTRDRLDFLSAEDREWMLRRTAEETFFK